MGQVKKEHIQKMILETALRMFAVDGFKNTTIADIAREAKISVGNIYRYHDSKKKILEAVLPETFVTKLRYQLYKKIMTGATSNITEQSNDPSYILYSREFQFFILENKLRLLILFRYPEETPYETFREEFVQNWVQIILDHFIQKETLREAKRKTLSILCNGFIELYISVLTKTWSEAEILEEMKHVNQYHIFGLASILED